MNIFSEPVLTKLIHMWTMLVLGCLAAAVVAGNPPKLASCRLASGVVGQLGYGVNADLVGIATHMV